MPGLFAMLQDSCRLLLIHLMTCIEHAVKSVYGVTPSPDAGSVSDRAMQLKALFDADPSAFVADSAKLSALRTILADYGRQHFPALTTTITIEIPSPATEIAWEHVTGKPVKYPPVAHTHPAQPVTWEDVQSKPTTFPPSDHTHAAQPVTWEDVQSKPSTFPPADHTHTVSNVEWESVLNKPTTFAPSTHTHAEYALTTHGHADLAAASHSHDYSAISNRLRMSTTRYLGNVAASRTISIDTGFTPSVVILRNDSNGTTTCLTSHGWGGWGVISGVTDGSVTIASPTYWNASGTYFQLIAFGA